MRAIPAASPLGDLTSAAPPGRFLSNGRYLVHITSAGTGFSAAGDCRLNVWSGDRIEDADGFFVYVRDAESGRLWSAGDRPVGRPAERYECEWTPGDFVISRTDDTIETRMEVSVPSDDPVEVRRITLTNRGRRPRRLEVTSYLEVLLGRAEAHAAHPAFSKLFIRTDWVETASILVATRRPRARDESAPCLFHAILEAPAPERETDRERFVGRMRSLASPRALAPAIPLSGTTGDVLDPILSLRRTIDLPPGGSAGSTFVLGAAGDRREACEIVGRLAAGETGKDHPDDARRREERELRAAGLSEGEGAYAQEIASALLYGHPALRAPSIRLERARGTDGDLEWLGVSRRRPFAVLHAERPAGRRLLGPLLAIHRYWRGVAVGIDLVIVCEEPAALRAEARNPLDGPVRLVAAADLSTRTREWLDAAARLVVDDRLPDLGPAVRSSAGSASPIRRGA